MHIAVVGSGYVGLVAGACFADLGHEVILVDNDERKLTALENGQVPIHEKFLPELLQRHQGQRLHFSNDLQRAVKASAAVFIAVGTPPTEHGEADLSYVESVASSIPSAEYTLIVWCAAHNENTPNGIAMGSVSRIVNGCRNDSNCAASTMYMKMKVRAKARMKSSRKQIRCAHTATPGEYLIRYCDSSS